jgi:Fe-S-cluster containining protein
MTSEYRALVAKVAAFTDATGARREADMTCSAGCSSCCHAWLTVSAVEAHEIALALSRLGDDAREAVRQRGERELRREASQAAPARCAMLDDEGRCDVYEARPLVCRTQGHALRYPAGVIPADTITRKTTSGDLTWCPLNYGERAPEAEDVLDAERVNQILAVVAERHEVARGIPRHTRVALSALAAETDVLHDDAAPARPPARRHSARARPSARGDSARADEFESDRELDD